MTDHLSKDAILRSIAERRAVLDDLVAAFGPAERDIAGADGWRLQEHLAHIASWELSLLALLDGGDRDVAMGLEPGAYQRRGLDAINESVADRHRSRPFDEVLAFYRDTHRRVVARLETMTDADFQRPYSHYQPNDPPYNANPVAGWVGGNTAEHYDEHIGWLTGLLASTSPA